MTADEVTRALVERLVEPGSPFGSAARLDCEPTVVVTDDDDRPWLITVQPA